MRHPQFCPHFSHESPQLEPSPSPDSNWPRVKLWAAPHSLGTAPSLSTSSVPLKPHSGPAHAQTEVFRLLKFRKKTPTGSSTRVWPLFPRGAEAVPGFWQLDERASEPRTCQGLGNDPQAGFHSENTLGQQLCHGSLLSYTEPQPDLPETARLPKRDQGFSCTFDNDVVALFTHSLDKHQLYTCFVPGTVGCSEDTQKTRLLSQLQRTLKTQE